jgi:hypothetical protein
VSKRYERYPKGYLGVRREIIGYPKGYLGVRKLEKL